MTETGELMHADQADLIRLMDGELSPAEQAPLAAHLQACSVCAEQLRLLEKRSRTVSELLRSIDLVAPAIPLRASPRRRRTPAWQAVAALVALGIAGAMAVPPVRAWVVTVARAAWLRVTGPTDASLPAESRRGAVSFLPSGTTLTIRVPVQPGRLMVEGVVTERVSVSGADGLAVPGLLILPDELRFTVGDSGDYIVRVPVGLETIRVLIGNEPARLFRLGTGERRIFPLAGP